MKLHLACGPVYLDGYTNVDVVGELASASPELVKENRTTLDNYFKRSYKKRELGHNVRIPIVVDVRADVVDLPFESWSVDEILSVNLIDHLYIQQRAAFIDECWRILVDGGLLITDVGDARGNAKLLVEAQTREEIEWALRLMYCHGRDYYDSHHWGYTPEYLRELMEVQAFNFEWSRTDYIDHVYPSFQLCMRKVSR